MGIPGPSKNICQASRFWDFQILGFPILGFSDFGIFRSTFWPGDVLGAPQKVICEKTIFWRGCRGNPHAKTIPMVPRTHMVVLLCQKQCFLRFSSQSQVFPENRGTPQGRFLYMPYFPLWDALFCLGRSYSLFCHPQL